jgi:DNA invertase Pin-like site-specific DNA recombinase
MEYVVYYRVSTTRQDYGIDAQRAAVRAFLKSGDSIIAEYEEQESGTHKMRHKRVELTKAVNHAKGAHAVLLIAKMDRLTRSVGTLMEILDAGVEVCACDMPSISRMVMVILAAVAEEEARLISTRTKAALEVVRARGGRVGRAKGDVLGIDVAKACAESAKVRKAKAVQHYSTVTHLLEAWAEMGLSKCAMAKRLNERGYKTRHGKQWTSSQVCRVLRAA